MKKILGAVVALFLVAFALVGLSAKSASAAETCQPDLYGASSNTWNVDFYNPTSHGTADDITIDPHFWFYKCETQNGTHFLKIYQLDYIMTFSDITDPWTGNCGSIKNITINPENFGTTNWNPDPHTEACDGEYWAFGMQPPANTRIFANSPNDEACVGGTVSFAENPLIGNGYWTLTMPAACPRDVVGWI